MISINGKYIKNTGVYHGFENIETATMFFSKKIKNLKINLLQFSELKCWLQFKLMFYIYLIVVSYLQYTL